MSEKLTLILGAPGEAEMPLLADLGMRPDVTILGVFDPGGQCLGGAIAEIMGLPVVRSLDQLNLNGGPPARVVLPSQPPSLAAELARMAGDHGLRTIRPEEVRGELLQPRARAPRRPARQASGTDLAAIERETEALQASLADLEDALAGDAIMRRLVEICARAVGASGGSLMLLDETSRELYIAYATGLSEGTIHGTRVKVGEGISGSVAHSRQPRLVEGRLGPDTRHRDRPDIATAICTPLLSDDDLLGVLNVSTQATEEPLTAASLEVLEGLSQRLARILDEVLDLQRQRTSRMFHLTEQQLRRLAGDLDELPAMLAAWTGVLAVTAEADRVCLAVPCEDGSLLLAEGTPGQDGHHWYEPLHNPAWLEVLGSGMPMVVREESTSRSDRDPVTVFYLPVGRRPVHAGLAVHFSGSRLAHAFHALAGETAFLLDRLLPDLIAQRHQSHRTAMLSRLSATMADLTVSERTPGRQLEHLSDAARQLTGARFGVVIESVGEGSPRLAAGNAPEDASWLADCSRLLQAAADDGWRITTIETREAPLSVLVVANPSGGAVPGMVLVGKVRTHDLDGNVFTPLDAELVLPLAGMLTRLMPTQDPEPQLITVPVPEPDAVPDLVVPLADPGALVDLDAASTSGSRPDPDALVIDLSALAETHDVQMPGAQASRHQDPEACLLEDLEREIDRCNRYHNVFGMVMLSLDLTDGAAVPLLEAAARRLMERLRISDRVYTLPQGELVLLIPEDVRNLQHLQARVLGDLRQLTADPDQIILAARAAYPSVKGPAEAFLATVRARLKS